MNQLSDLFIAGFSISFIITGLNGVAFLYFIWTTEQVIKAHNQQEVKAKRSKFIWVYFISCLSSLAMGLLYLLEYYGQGLALVPPNLFVATWRWLFIAVVGALYMVLVGCVLSPGKHHPGQSVAAVILYLASYLCLYEASCSESRETRIIWATFSILFFLMCLVSLFFPDSVLFHHYQEVRDIVCSESSVWALMFRPIKKESRECSIKLWAFILPFLLFLQIVLSFLGYIITWFLSDGNQFTATSDFRQTNLSFLVFDMILLVPLWLVVACLTFQRYIKKVTITDTSTEHKQVSSLYAVQTKYGRAPPF